MGIGYRLAGLSLLGVIGDHGNLVIPTLSFSSIDEKAPFFDVNETPSDCGVISETFRKMPGVARSIHPFSSIAAFGPESLFITVGHHPTPCGIGSPYYKVLELQGYSLFIGAGLQANTLFHVAEEIVNPPYLRYKCFKKVRVKTESGAVVSGTFSRYDCYQTGIIRELEKMEEVLRKRGAIRDFDVGNSHFMLVSAVENVRISCEVLKHNYEFILKGAK
ncbi:AAC(3) family N-acetyltransferase [Paenactinomyces guangxiensis]|uniref:Aminoglycoside N(3)-acetyltransferase n=1 Tax=Paenactinomyces guangxiensis TaxID=1490290 RepID=A0A7W1WPH7_9BACL|nr:AAC(3) family N-acetyltransferase [Paenactinomyces guangxiensis]MBA4493529.1 AAC(3) family N-acetyltransferase [Paenactinomyces guangxiensis]MBH8590620.1 AAC(3) family N-acetyltransferase [Paenactinomyces guangxiensis]